MMIEAPIMAQKQSIEPRLLTLNMQRLLRGLQPESAPLLPEKGGDGNRGRQ